MAGGLVGRGVGHLVIHGHSPVHRLAPETKVVSTFAFVLATVISQFAVDNPDGLEKVAIDEGFIDSGRDHALDSIIFSDYATSGVGNETLSLAVAGVSGVLITLLVGLGLISAARQGRNRVAAS